MKQRRNAIAAAAIALCFGAVANASAPQQRTQAPGYYRMMLGDFEITALSDGTVRRLAHQFLINTTPEQVKAALQRSFLPERFEGSVNAFLINTGSKLVLIDTGAGGFAPSTGKLLTNLKASGYQPEQVDEVYLTHLHHDHVGGLMVNGERAFPNAIVRASQAEADSWLSKEKMEAAPVLQRGRFRAAMNALNPYIAAGRFKPFTGEVELIPGIRAIAAPGHSPGHTLYAVESRGEKLVAWGDIVHIAAVQFEDPSVSVRPDSDPQAAAAQRRKVLADAVEHGYWIAGAHLSFPGIGHLRASGSEYIFVPPNYGTF